MAKSAKGLGVPYWVFVLLFIWLGIHAQRLPAQSEPTGQPPPKFQGETTQDYNQRLEQLRKALAEKVPEASANEYRIGPEDLLEITVFEAPELNRSVRISASGEFSLPLLGAVKAAGLTPRELEFVLQELLRRTYMKEPHVGVFVRELQSHPVSVVGAVKKPGVFQIRGTKSLLEVLSMAEGLADDAGDTILVMRGAGLRGVPSQDDNKQDVGTQSSPPVEQATGAAAASSSPRESAVEGTVEINLKSLLESGDPRYNVPIHPGDIVKVTRAGIVYVVGEVKRSGGFVLKSNENISVLQALALAEGLTRTSAKSQARIIRADEKTGQRSEIPLNLQKILEGKAPDVVLQSKDIVFVPNSAGRSALYRSAEAAVSILSGVAIYRR